MNSTTTMSIWLMLLATYLLICLFIYTVHWATLDVNSSLDDSLLARSPPLSSLSLPLLLCTLSATTKTWAYDCKATPVAVLYPLFVPVDLGGMPKVKVFRNTFLRKNTREKY